MEEEKIPEMELEEEKTQEIVPIKKSRGFVSTEKPPGFNWVQIVLAMGVVIALILAGWNAFSIIGTDKEMNAEDSDLMSEIEAVNSSLSGSINVLDNNTSNQISSLNDSIGALNENMSGQIKTLDGRISDLQNRLTQEKDYLIDMLESLNSTLQDKIDDLQNNVSVLDGNIAQIDSDIDELDGNIAQIDSDIDSMQTYIQSLQDQLDTLKGRVTILEQACDLDDDGIFDKYDDDDDGDGYNDTEDAFPNDATEWKDNDNDGIGDNADPDDDNDGWEDWNDYLPYKDAKIKITVISFTLEDTNDDVYFEIWADGNTIRSPVFWDCPNGWEYWVNLEFEFNIDDCWEFVSIYISMIDEDINAGNDYLDIEGKSASYSLWLDYNIVTGEWTGDDDDGYSSGFDDGRTGESDVLFSYNIETV